MDKLGTGLAELGVAIEETFAALLDYVPALLAAGSLLLLGWLFAMLGRYLVRRFLAGLDWVLGLATARSPEAAARLQSATANAVASVAFWAIWFVFAVAAVRTLGSSLVDEWTSQLFSYLPALISGALIVVLGFVGGAFLRHVIEPAASGLGIHYSAFLGRLSQAAVVTVGVLIGFGQLGINVDFLVTVLTVVVATALLAVGLSLALGTREQVANIVGARYARKYCRVGDIVRVGDLEGRLVSVADGYLFLETENGDLSLPARYYTRQPFLKIRGSAPGES